MPVDMISGHLQYLLKEESIPFEEHSLRLLARAADGSMRDALSLLDQAIAFGGSKVNETDVREMLGSVSHEPLIALLKSVSAGEGVQLLQQVEDLSGVSPDFAATCDALIALLHQLAVQQVVPDSIQEEDSIEVLAKSLTKEEVQLFYQIALQGRGDLALAPDPRSGFEMILLRMMSFRPLRQGMQIKAVEESITVENASANEEINKKKTIKSNLVIDDSNTVKNPINKAESPPWEVLPESLKSDSNVSQETTSKKNIETLDISVSQSNHVSEKSTVEPIKTNSSNIEWHEVVPKLKLSGRAAELIKHCLLEQQESGIISLKLDQSSEGLLADSIHLEIQTALTAYYDDSYKLEITVADAVNNEEQTDSNIQSRETPAQRSDREKIEIQQLAENNINSDPFVIELQSRFGGQVVTGSVHPK
jgi:DNA polymerase-3 subunit gamma/tau